MGDSVTNRARNLLNQFIINKETPGIQYAVFDTSRSLFEFTGGFADIKSGKLMTSDTTLMAYSMTKTITAVAVLKLVEKKHLDLESPVQKYLPSFPYGEKVLVRHLLAQTSGLPNPIPLRWVHQVHEHDQFDEKAALKQIAKDHPKLSFKPGEKYAYSNISYWYLGELLEKISGITYQEFEKNKIFAPLGISENEMSFSFKDPALRAKGYLKKWSFMNFVKGFVTDSNFWGDYEDGWLEILPHYPNGASFGGIIGNVNGFKKFLQDQLKNSSGLLNLETKALFYQQQHNANGPIEMTLGWHIGTLDGVRYYYKEGGGAGYHSEMRIYPSKKIASVILTNSTGFNSRFSLSQVDSLFVKD